MKKTILFSTALMFSLFFFAQERGLDAPTNPWSGTSLNGDTYRNGNVAINSSLPNGSTFLNTIDRNEKCNILRAGAVLSSQTSLLNFFDFPQSNIDPQALSFFAIEDRNYKSRFSFFAKTGADSGQLYYDKTQSIIYSLTENGLGFVHLQLPKLDSHLTIGTSSYQDGSTTYALSVNGKVRAESVKVYTDWADFVFENDYKLPSLKEVEQHINENGHLKNIPSAKEVEENGIDVGEMNKLLLQKIEELTLYTIEQQKQIESLTNTVEKLILVKN